MAEMNATINAPILYNADKYFVRSEWGQNENVHFHSLSMSESLSKKFNEIKQDFLNEIDRLESNFNKNIAENTSNDNYEKHFDELKADVENSFKNKQQEYMKIMKQYYTNWNSGFTKRGEKHLISILIVKVLLRRRMLKK